MIRFHAILYCLIVLIGFSGCRVNSQNPYNLNFPTEGFQLNSQLDEISGLHFYNDSTLLAIQDEKGKVYFLNPLDGTIKQTYLFGKKGDYEGVTANEKHIFVLKSNGDITRINMRKDTHKVYEFKNSKGFDFEGLCLDAANYRLLIACKEHGKKDKNDQIYIYAFNLETKEYESSPVYSIPKQTLSPLFKPSGIAIHPHGDLYVLSSIGKMLMTLSPDGEVLRKEALLKTIFNQPEGITFSPDGDLFISNEKKNKYPTLLKFSAP